VSNTPSNRSNTPSNSLVKCVKWRMWTRIHISSAMRSRLNASSGAAYLKTTAWVGRRSKYPGH